MDLIHNLILGFSTALAWNNLLFCLIGALIGTMIGVLPGIGPLPTIALLLPFTFGMAPASAFIMLAGIFYGAQYGGSTTAVLVNIPGETSSVVTCLDGHQMARQGKAGTALAIAALASFFAGSVATLVIALASAPLSRLAMSFTAVEFFSLMVLGLVAAVILAHGAVLKSLAMVGVGLLLGVVGIDVNSGAARMTFNIPEFADGLGFVSVAMGFFGLAEIITNLEKPAGRIVVSQKARDLLPSWADLRAAFPAMVRGTAIGSLLGVLPGGGSALPPFTAYAVEKKLARDPTRFGKGAIEGVASPEAANNAGAQTSFIPLLTLGIPSNALMALMIGALMIHGIQPGPQIINEQPELVWGVIASMWTGNLMLLVINLPLIGIWVSMLKIPYRLLFPAILLFCCIGAYGVNNSVVDVWLMLGCALVGYFFNKVGVETPPLLLGMVLGPQLEENLRRAERSFSLLDHLIGSLMRFDGKVVLITGSGVGIGRAAALAYAQAGACVAVNSRSARSGAETLDVLTAAGYPAIFVQGDVACDDDARRLVDTISEADWERTFAVNVKGTYLVSRHAIAAMRQVGGGVIVNVASLAGQRGVPDRAAYSASKGALLALTRAMARDHLADNIRVNSVSPGMVLTPSLEQRLQSFADPAKARAEFMARQPMGRFGEEQEIATAILFASCDEAAFMTGENIAINGGKTL